MVRINAVTRCFCQWLAFSGLNLTDVSFSCIAFENSALLQSTPLWSSQHESQNTHWTSCGIWARNVEQREIIFIYDGKYIKARQICYKTTRISWWGSIQDQSPFSGSPARRFVLFLTVLISVYLSVFEQFRSIPVYLSPSKNEWRISSRIRSVMMRKILPFLWRIVIQAFSLILSNGSSTPNCKLWKETWKWSAEKLRIKTIFRVAPTCFHIIISINCPVTFLSKRQYYVSLFPTK